MYSNIPDDCEILFNVLLACLARKQDVRIWAANYIKKMYMMISNIFPKVTQYITKAFTTHIFLEECASFPDVCVLFMCFYFLTHSFFVCS